MIRILIVDDQVKLATSVAQKVTQVMVPRIATTDFDRSSTALRTSLNSIYQPESTDDEGGKWKSFPLVDVRAFERAYEAIEFLHEIETAGEVPTIAIIDIDFAFEQEKAHFPDPSVQEKAAQTKGRSARLGWVVAAKLNEVAARFGLRPVMVLYTGRDDVIRDFREVVQKVRWERGEIPPLLPVETKEVSIKTVLGYVIDAVHEVGRRKLDEGHVRVEDLDRLGKLGGEEKRNWSSRAAMLVDFAELFRLFPYEAVSILKHDGNSRLSMLALLDRCGPVDQHWPLCKAFKTVRWKGEDTYFTPLAAACHGIGWDLSRQNRNVVFPGKVEMSPSAWASAGCVLFCVCR